MSDGPYKSLNMSRHWKRVAKLAANTAHSPEEVAEAIRPALLRDMALVRPAFAQALRAALGDNERGNLFLEVAASESQRLRAQAGNPMEALLADHVCDMARDGQLGAGAYEAATKGCLDERMVRGGRQMHEHYLREDPKDADALRAGFAAAVGVVGTDRLAAGVAEGAGLHSLAPKVDRSGLDEGVPL